jgi:uncharacterized membrane protein YvbJ
MKKCPFCAEEIQEEAVKCKHCGEFLIDAELKRMKMGAGSPQTEWYYKTPMVILWILLLGPFALSFIWKNPQYNASSKIIWTIIAIGYTAIITLMLIGVIIFYVKWLGQIASKGL